MSRQAQSTAGETPDTGQELVPVNVAAESEAENRHDRARPIPRISIQAFCENGETAEALQVAAEDRRLAKAHVSIHMGGAEAAVAHYQASPTPNLIVIESTAWLGAATQAPRWWPSAMSMTWCSIASC